MSKINATTRRQSEATCRCNLLRGMAGLQKYQTQERERDDVLHVFLRGRGEGEGERGGGAYDRRDVLAHTARLLPQPV